MTFSLPGFLIVGAAKAGTTTMFQLLSQHPEVFLPDVKECRFFSNIGRKELNPFTGATQIEYIKNIGAYRKLFSRQAAKALGDVSPDYLFYYKDSIKNIKKHLSRDVKIIISLRDPVERAFSNYMHLRRDRLTGYAFYEYLQAEEGFDKETTWYGFLLKESGLYSSAVNAYLNAFDNVSVIFFEDFISDLQEVMKKISTFLMVSPDYEYSMPKFTNKTGLPRSRILDMVLSKNWHGKHKLLQFIRKIAPEFSIQAYKEWNLVKPEMDSKSRAFLMDYYRDDVERLQNCLSSELPWIWCK